MAKALFGHLPVHDSGAAALGREHAVLRQRVADLTDLVERLQVENDLLRETVQRNEFASV